MTPDGHETGRPIPMPDATSAPYWSAARQHRLALQVCADCRKFQHPPALVCRHCGARELTYAEVATRGRVYSFTVSHHNFTAETGRELPYAIGIVEVDGTDGARILANFTDTPLDAIHVGAAVDVVFEDISADISLPQFRLISDRSASPGGKQPAGEQEETRDR
jgi:uncharacterized protein